MLYSQLGLLHKPIEYPYGAMSSNPAVCGLASRWQTKFALFVRHYGTARLARDLEVEPAAIYQWIRGSTSPRLPKARTIMALSAPFVELKLVLEDIYQHREAVVEDAGLPIQRSQHPTLQLTKAAPECDTRANWQGSDPRVNIAALQTYVTYHTTNRTLRETRR